MENGRDATEIESFTDDEMDTDTDNSGATTEDINSILQRYEHLDNSVIKSDLDENVLLKGEVECKTEPKNVAEKERKFLCQGSEARRSGR